jgi:hypothetical protein
MSDGDPWQRFPSFAPLFGDAVPVPLYLQLLNLDDPEEAQGATEAIRRAIRQTSNRFLAYGIKPPSSASRSRRPRCINLSTS